MLRKNILTSLLFLVATPLATARTMGVGAQLSGNKCVAYQNLKNSPRVQWALHDLDSGREVAASESNAGRRFFGASTSKMFVGAVLLEEMKGQLTSWQMERLKLMIIRSNNAAWKQLQAEIGRVRRTRGLCSSGDSNKTCGQQAIANFTNRMGYKNTRAYSGTLRQAHGNELNARDTSRFLADTYQGKYPGAKVLWDIMAQYRTGSRKGNKYMPSNVAVGGKTGTYAGPTRVNEVNTRVNARNTAMFFKGGDGRQYGLTILSDDGQDETVALLAGGLARQYAGISNSCGNLIGSSNAQTVAQSAR